MNWKANYPKTMTMRHWIKWAALIVALAMVLWTIISVRMSSQGENMKQHKNNEKKISQMATKHDVSQIVPDANQLTPIIKNSISSASLANEKIQSGTQSNHMPAVLTTGDMSDDTLKAMRAPITQNQISSSATTDQPTSEPTRITPASNREASNSADQNLQAEKKNFLTENNQLNNPDYLGATLQTPVSHFEIQAGTIIPGVLITGADSDLPGQVIGQVRENVYDSISGKYLLIPQGAKLVGVYDSQVAYGQTRVLVAWNRIIFPNGKSMDLKGMPGTDLTGYAGFNDEVDNHYMKIFGSVVLLSVLSAGAQLSQPQNQNNSILTVSNPTVGQTVAQSLGTNIANTGTMLTQKNINIQPTLEIRQGYEFNITATKDMVFPSAYME